MVTNFLRLAAAAAVTATSLGFSAVPSVAAAPSLHAITQSVPANIRAKGQPGTCVVEISTVSLTPLEAYDGSGGNIIFNGTTNGEALCAKTARQQYQAALSTGWSPANRCAIIAGTGPSDEILTEVTYIFNGGPSTRADGYGTMCNPTTTVPNVPAY